MQSTTLDSVRAYLQEIGRIPLLSAAEEIELAKLVQKMMQLLEKKEELSKKLGRKPNQREWADYVETSEAELESALKKGERAKRKMIEANLRLVVAIAKKYQKRNMEFLDLIQEGNIGLNRAVEKFNPKLGYKFSTYAYWWIRQAMTRAICQQSRSIYLPGHIWEKFNKLKKTYRELAQQKKRPPNLEEVSIELGWKSEEIKEYLRLDSQIISLDLEVGEGIKKSSCLLDHIPDEKGSPFESLVEEEQAEKVLELLKENLQPNEAEIIILRYGIEGLEPQTLSKIGKKYNLSRERIRQIEGKGLRKLKKKGKKVYYQLLE